MEIKKDVLGTYIVGFVTAALFLCRLFFTLTR